MIKLKKLNEEGLTGGVGSFDAGDTGVAYKTLGSIPGQGVIQYPTRDSTGSGDVPSPPVKRKKKKKKKLHEGMKYLRVIQEYTKVKVETAPKKKIAEELIPGGLSSGKTVQDIAKKHGVSVEEIEAQLAKGTKVELEHTGDEKKAREIAMDHLMEDPKYYDKLASIEKPEKKIPVEEDENIKSSIKVEEDLGSGKEVFETGVSKAEVDGWNEPAEWESLSITQAKVFWEADFEIENYGIGGVNLSVSKIDFAGEVDKGEEYQDWELTVTSEQFEIEIGKLPALIPLYPTNVEIDFSKSANRKDWKIKVTFGSYD